MHIDRSSHRSKRVFPRSTASQQQDSVKRTYNRLNRFRYSGNFRNMLIRLIQNLLAQLGRGHIRPEPPKDDPIIRPVYGAPIVQPPKDDDPILRPVYGAPIVRPPEDDLIIRPVYGAPGLNRDSRFKD